MKREIIYFTALISCLALAACDNYLDVKPKGALIPTMYDEYSKILDYEYHIRFADGDIDIVSDDVYLPDNIYSSWLGAPNQRSYRWEDLIYYSGDRDNAWSSAYSRIFNYNLIIEEIDNAGGATVAHKTNLKAEAKLARAYEYLRLVMKHAKPYDVTTAGEDLAIPLRLRPVVAPEILTRASTEQVFAQIESDISAVLNSTLPDVNELRWRGSKAAAHALTAQMYLFKREYEAAYTAANTALGYFGSDIPIEDFNDYKIVDVAAGRGRTDMPDGNNVIDAVYLRIGEQGVTSGYTFIADGLKALFETGDKRFELYFANPYRGTTYVTEMFARHLMNNIGIGIPELLLIRAECAARANNLTPALYDLNTLRQKRFTSDTYAALSSSNQQEVIRWTLEERRRELCFMSGARWFDMKRLSKDPDFRTPTVTRTVNGETYTLAPDSPRYAFPIWLLVIESNPGMPQN